MNKTIPQVISLTPSERKLLTKIEFNTKDSHNLEVLRASCAAASPLTKSLIARKVLPKIRVKFFTDTELNIGTQKSRQQVFESKGTVGEAIFIHGHFLKYLYYFIYGPNLPKQVIEEFCKIAYIYEYVSGEEIDALRKLARKSTRQYHIPSKDAAVEFFKLALECDIDIDTALLIRKDVLAIKLRTDGRYN